MIRDAPKLTTQQAHIDWRCRTWGADKSLYPTGRLTASDIARAHRAALHHTNTNNNKNNKEEKEEQEQGRKASGLRTHALLRDEFVPRTAQGAARGGGVRAAPADKRVILTDLEAVPCPPLLREMVGAIVQIRRNALLSSVLEDEDDDDDDDEYETFSPSSGSTSRGSPTSRETEFSDVISVFSQAAGQDVSHPNSLPSSMGREGKPQPPKGVTIGSIAWSVPEDEASNLTHETVRVPVMVDQKAGTVTVPIGVPYSIGKGGKTIVVGDPIHPLEAIRIKTAKVEGSFTKPASQALFHFLQWPLLPRDVQQDEYAVDVMARRLEL